MLRVFHDKNATVLLRFTFASGLRNTFVMPKELNFSDFSTFLFDDLEVTLNEEVGQGRKRLVSKTGIYQKAAIICTLNSELYLMKQQT